MYIDDTFTHMDKNVTHDILEIATEIKELLEIRSGEQQHAPSMQDEILIRDYALKQCEDPSIAPTPDEESAIKRAKPIQPKAWENNIQRALKNKALNNAQIEVLYKCASPTLKAHFTDAMTPADITSTLKHAFIDSTKKLTCALKLITRPDDPIAELDTVETLKALEKTLLDLSYNYRIIVEKGYLPDCVFDIFETETVPAIRQNIDLLSPNDTSSSDVKIEKGTEHFTQRLPQNFWDIK